MRSKPGEVGTLVITLSPTVPLAAVLSFSNASNWRVGGVLAITPSPTEPLAAASNLA